MNKKIHFASNIEIMNSRYNAEVQSAFNNVARNNGLRLACGNTATHRPRVHGIFFTANAEKVTCTKCIAALA